jgi:integrase
MGEEETMKGVYQRGRVWWIRYRFNGKYIHQSIGDRVLAERTMEEIRRRIQDGRHEIKFKDERRTFAEMADEYLEAKSNKRSLRCDRSMLRHLVPVFGSSLVHTITKAEVEVYARTRRKTVSGATVNRDLALLRHLFNLAIEKGYMRDNPVRGVKKAKESPSRRKYIFTEDEIQALVNASAPHLRPILAVAIGTGLRKGDILGLRWDEVDFAHNVISLYQQKTEEPLEIPMLAMVRELLWRLKGTAGESPLVFAWEGKRIVDIRRAFHTALRRSGLAAKGYHFHDLRRTFATMLYNRGVHLTKIQRLLGHRSILTTERYLGVKFEETRQAIAVLDVPAMNALAAPGMGTNRVQSPAQPIEIPLLSVS